MGTRLASRPVSNSTFSSSLRAIRIRLESTRKSSRKGTANRYYAAGWKKGGVKSFLTRCNYNPKKSPKVTIRSLSFSRERQRGSFARLWDIGTLRSLAVSACRSAASASDSRYTENDIKKTKKQIKKE